MITNSYKQIGYIISRILTRLCYCCHLSSQYFFVHCNASTKSCFPELKIREFSFCCASTKKHSRVKTASSSKNRDEREDERGKKTKTTRHKTNDIVNKIERPLLLQYQIHCGFSEHNSNGQKRIKIP